MHLSSSVQLRPNRTTWTRLHLSSSVSHPLRGETELDNPATGLHGLGGPLEFAQSRPAASTRTTIEASPTNGGSLPARHTCGLDDRGNSLHSLPAGRFVSLWSRAMLGDFPFRGHRYNPPALPECAEISRSSSPQVWRAGRDPPSICTPTVSLNE